jgi:ATP synthase protein I
VTDDTITATVSVAMNDHRESPEHPAERQGLGELAGMDYGMRVLSYLIAGVLFYGGLGWVGDHVLGTRFLLPIGILLGAAGGCYVVIRRYGRVPERTSGVTGRQLSRAGRRLDNPWQSRRTAPPNTARPSHTAPPSHTARPNGTRPTTTKEGAK